MAVTPPASSIRALRNLLLGALVVVALGLALAVTSLVQGVFDELVPQIRADLELKTRQTARELGKSSDLGLAIGDPDMVRAAFKPHLETTDLVAIVARGTDGSIVAEHGALPFPEDALFSAEPGRVVEARGVVFTWEPSAIEGARVGEIAVVYGLEVIAHAEAFRARLTGIIWMVCGGGVLAGLAVLLFFTRQVVQRDARLARHASVLEETVAARTVELKARNLGMRLLLDHVTDGFLSLRVDGRVEPERSSVADAWFPELERAERLPDIWRAQGDSSAADWVEMTLEQIAEGFMPPDFFLSQLPERIYLDERELEARYLTVDSERVGPRILAMLTDRTLAKENERIETEQRELFEIFQLLGRDRVGFFELLKEVRTLTARFCDDTSLDGPTAKRIVHTLKGNVAPAGLQTFVRACHEIEAKITGDPPNSELREALRRAWNEVDARISVLVGEQTESMLELSRSEHERLLQLAESGAPSGQLAEELRQLGLDPVQKRLERLAEQARATAHRLGRGEVQVVAEAHGLRLDADAWGPFWSTMVHMVRNAVDHGIEPYSDRLRLGKPPAGLVELEARLEAGQLYLSVSDDGRGIDWTRLAERAARIGLATDRLEDVAEAMFADGVSSRSNVTETSGRGIGMAAVREMVGKAGGEILVTSTPGQGTRICLALGPPGEATRRLLGGASRRAPIRVLESEGTSPEGSEPQIRA